MKSKILLFLLFTTAIIYSACSGGAGGSAAADEMLKSIPNDVSMVTAIDADAILEKADFENVKQMEFYKEMLSETKKYNATLADVLADPAKSGVDLSKNIYVAHNLDPDNPEEVFIGIVASVKDKAALETLVGASGDLKRSSQDGFELATKGSQSVAWNGEKVVLGMTNSYNDPVVHLQKYFNTTAENTIANDNDLKKAMSGNHDITSWMSSNALANSPTLKNALIMASIDADAAKNNFIHSYVDFNNGAIESKSDLYLQDALVEDLNLLFKNKVRTDFSGMIPSNANSVMSVALDLEGIQSVLQKKGVIPMANYGLQAYGLTVDDIASTFGGDILLYSTPGAKETPQGTFVTSIRDLQKLDKFIAIAQEFGLFKKLGDNHYNINNTAIISGRGFNGQDAQIVIEDNIIMISADPDIIAKMQAGGYKGNEAMDASKVKLLKSDIFAGFADFDALMQNAPDVKLDLNFKDLKFSTNRKNSEFMMNFKDKNTNSLKQLFESINEIFLAEQKGEI